MDDDPEKQNTDFEHEGTVVPILSLEEAARLLPNAVYIPTVSADQGLRAAMKDRLKERRLLSKDSSFYPKRYLFLIEGGFEALNPPLPANDGASFLPKHIDNIIIFSSMGHTGTVFFDCLMDGHPNVLNIGVFGALSPSRNDI